MHDTTQLVRGTLHLLILRALVAGPQHGYAVAEQIAERTSSVVVLEEGALYQALHRMEERGWLESEWGRSETGKRARFYTLTKEGRARLRAETASWLSYAEAVSRMLQPEPA